MPDYMWWLKNLLHIETLVGLFIVGVILYLIFSKNKKTAEEKVLSFLNIVDEKHESSMKMRKKGMYEGYEGLSKTKKKNKKKRYKHEERCREIFEGIFGVEFPSVRPDWLKNPVTGQNLELDGFNPNIRTPIGRGLAFEYDGEQHAKYNSHFHRNGPREFVYQYKKDTLKDQRCKQKGVLLIRIPHYIDHSELDMFIVKRLEKYRLV